MENKTKKPTVKSILARMIEGVKVSYADEGIFYTTAQLKKNLAWELAGEWKDEALDEIEEWERKNEKM